MPMIPKGYQKAAVGRLALRVEGEFWNAYFAHNDTMVGATLLGSIRMAYVQDKARKKAFQRLMAGVVAEAVKEVTGHTPKMVTEPAPEHERTRKA